MLLNELNKKKILVCYLIYLLFIIISSTIYGFLLNLKVNIYDDNLNIIFNNIPFSNGELIYNLYYNSKYYNNFNNIVFYLLKTPAIPFLITFLAFFSKNFFFILIFIILCLTI